MKLTNDQDLKITYDDKMEKTDFVTVRNLRDEWLLKGERQEWIDGFMEQLSVQGYAFSKFAKYELISKPIIIFNFRISVDETQKQRFTEKEVKTEIKNNNVTIKNCLICRKNDGKVIGEIIL